MMERWQRDLVARVVERDPSGRYRAKRLVLRLPRRRPRGPYRAFVDLEKLDERLRTIAAGDGEFAPKVWGDVMERVFAAQRLPRYGDRVPSRRRRRLARAIRLRWHLVRRHDVDEWSRWCETDGRYVE